MADNTTAIAAIETGEVRTRTRLMDLRENERHWIWKAGLRAIICILNIIAIGCVAWIIYLRVDIGMNPFLGEFDIFQGKSIGELIVLVASLFWCLLALFLPFVLKPVRPIHPGVAVGLDLILWLVFLFIGLLATTRILDIVNFGSDPTNLAEANDYYYYSGGSSYDGHYYLAPNNTWIYNMTSVDGDPNYIVSDVTRDCTPFFATCAEEDAYVNYLWQLKPRLEGVEITESAILFLDLILHFALFVWACVDTNTRNLSRRVRAEKIVADRIIKDLEKKGLITVRDGQVLPANASPIETSMPRQHTPYVDVTPPPGSIREMPVAGAPRNLTPSRDEDAISPISAR